MTDRERPDADPVPDAGAEPESGEGRNAEAAGGVEGRRFDLLDVTDDPAAAEPQTVVVAFRCPKCQQMLHIEYLVSPFGSASPEGAGPDGGGATKDGVECPQCGARHRLRLPGVVRGVWRAE